MILDSITCAEIKTYLSKTDTTTLLVDVFDTILCRKTYPEHIKKIVAARLHDHMDSIPPSAFYKARQEAQSYCYEKSFNTYGDKEIYYPELTEELYKRLKKNYGTDLFLNKALFCDLHQQIETTVEQRFICADPNVLNFLSEQKNSGKKIILLSDFYMQNAQVHKLLQSQGIENHFDTLIVSTDVFKTKRSGKLYQHLIENKIIIPEQTIMLGDNLHSDVRMAEQYGIKAFHIDRKKQMEWYKQQEHSKTSKKTLISEIKQLTQKDPESLFAYFPVLLLNIVQQLYVACLKNGTKSLYFLAREGKIIKTLFDTYQNFLTGNQPLIKTHYLLVSRRSTSAVSLGPLVKEDFNILFRQYTKISIKQFALSLAFDLKKIAAFCEDLNIDMEESHKDLSSSKSFHLLKTHPDFIFYYETTRKEQKKNFLNYFKKLNPMVYKEPIHLFDVGWKGTMQDNLAELFPNQKILGFYIGLLQPGSIQNIPYKIGLLFNYLDKDKIRRVFSENLSLFEVVLNAEHGSVLRYTSDEPYVECACDAYEEKIFTHYIGPMQKQIIQDFKELLPLFDKYALGVKSIAPYSIKEHYHKIYCPNKRELNWFQNIEHLENFGLFTYTKVAQYWASSKIAQWKLSWLLPLFKFYRLRILYR